MGPGHAGACGRSISILLRAALKYCSFIFAAALVFAQTAVSQDAKQPDLPRKEAYRIEILNAADGPIKVSTNEGRTWSTAGKVIYPCNLVNNKAYTASKWAETGAVAATAVNAIHIKAGYNRSVDKGVVFSLLPKEFVSPPENYNSFLSPNSSIYTDIKAGEGLFGGGYAPFVGDPVFISTSSDPVLKRMADGYVPSVNDILTIKVMRPVRQPKAIVFENRFGGHIKVIYWNGDSMTIGEVLKPVQGIGRFTGTQFAPAGRIRANHTGVIDISTSGRGRTGGFQIIPANHGMSEEMVKARLMTQWMVVGPTSIFERSLEGARPLFSNYLQPSYRKMDLESETWTKDLLSRFLVDVKMKGSDKWVPMPAYSVDPDYSKDLPEWANSALQDVTHVRILFPVLE